MSSEGRKQMLEAALWYTENGYSVIPIRKDKKPYIKWEKYQSGRADQNQIRGWWEKWPFANIGLVTGEASGIDVVDCDSEQGRDAINEFLPDSHIVPISKTPKGWHYFFSHKTGLANSVRVITDCDLRTTGGYIIVPPSKNGAGKSYAWMSGLSIAKVDPAPMPEMLFDILQSGGYANASSREHIKMYGFLKGDNNDVVSDNIRQQVTTSDNIRFDEGHRDNALFHLTNHLVKSRMPIATIEKYLSFFASNCNPPYPQKEISAKISSALKRSKNREKGLTEELRDLIVTASGNISTTFVYQVTTMTTREEKKKALVILGRFVKEGLLERTGQAGVYRKVENDCEPEDWQNAPTDTVNLWLPFGLNEMIEVMPGSIILFAGAQDAGKSAVQMNIAKENMRKWNVHYFSSELNAGAFKSRMNKFPEATPDQCPIKFYSRSENFHDVLRTGKNDLNIIDYLEIHDAFYKVSELLARIHEKLGQSICVVALQKDPNALYGRGGSFTQEKPILSVALDPGKATISKFKGEWRDENPRGKEYRFKLLDGCRFKKVQGWCKPPPKEK
jgi:bifunctional DNA primase/polymerase-like protein/primase-like protein